MVLEKRYDVKKRFLCVVLSVGLFAGVGIVSASGASASIGYAPSTVSNPRTPRVTPTSTAPLLNALSTAKSLGAIAAIRAAYLIIVFGGM